MNAKQMRAVLNANKPVDTEATEKATVLGMLLADTTHAISQAYDAVVNNTKHNLNHEDGALSNFITGYKYQQHLNSTK